MIAWKCIMMEKIKIAFCFDKNMIRPACVAIASLLDSKKKDVHFEIHCICPKDCEGHRANLNEIVVARDSLSELVIHSNPLISVKEYENRQFTSAVYFRLKLHSILPQLDRIIYADVDLFFARDISFLWEQNITGLYVCGVRSKQNLRDEWMKHMRFSYWRDLDYMNMRGAYINSGVLIMNLALIREKCLDKIWNPMMQKFHKYVDQDIINIVCGRKIGFLPQKYNRIMHNTFVDLDNMRREGLMNRQEMEEAIRYPAVLHLAGPKPCIDRGCRGAEKWWGYVNTQDDLRILFS